MATDPILHGSPEADSASTTTEVEQPEKPKGLELKPVEKGVTVYDKDDKPITVDPKQAEQAILQGSHGLDTKYQYSMVSPDGKEWNVPANGVQKALQGGWSLSETMSAKDKQDVARNIERNGAIGAGLTSFAKGAGSAISLGATDVLQNKYQTEEQKAVQAGLEAAHPIASTVGNVAGQVAGMGISAPAFGIAEAAGGLVERGILSAGEKALVEGATEQAIKAGVAKQMMAKVASYAAQGVVLSSPQAVTEAALGDPKAAAESLLWGGGLGAVLGSAAAVGGQAMPLIKSGIEAAAPKLNELADRMALKSTGVIKAGAKKLGEEGIERNAQILFDNGIIKPGAGFDEIKTKVEQLAKDSGGKIGEAMKGFDALLEQHPEELKQFSFNPAKAASTIESQLAAGLDNPMYAGERAELSKIVDTVGNFGSGELPEMPKKPKILSKYETELAEFEKDNPVDGFGRKSVFKDRPMSEEVQKYDTKIAEYNKAVDSNQAISFAKAQELKELFNKFPLSKLDPTPKEALQQQARGIVNRLIEESASNVVNAATEKGLNVSPEMFQDYLKQKQLYRASQELIKYGINNKVAQNFGNKAMSLTSNIFAAHGAAALASGNPVAALGIAGSIFVKHWAENKGLATGAYVLKKLANDPAALPFIGPLVAHASVSAFNKHFEQLGGSLMTKRIAQYEINHHIKNFLGEQANGLSKQQQMQLVTNKLSTMTSANALADGTKFVNESLGPHAPQVATAYNQTVNNAIQYLNNAVPKNPNPLISPFEINKWLPSNQQIRDFDEKFGIVQNPASILPHLAAGTVTKNQVDTLHAVYPAYADKLKNNLVDLAANKKIKLPTMAANKLSTLFGVPMTSTMKNLSALQATYNASPPGPSQPKQSKNSSNGRRSDLKELPSASTRTQRLMDK